MTLPELDPTTGFYKTLNRMGGMSPTLDDVSAAFVAFAPQAPGVALDVGAAYGIATLAALAAGATVIANDMEPRHLQILADRTPEVDRERLTLAPGSFPDDLALAPGSLGAVLLARMLHFLDGASIERGLAGLYEALAPGGKVFGVAVTPYLRKLVPFQPTYAARVVAGERWPGQIDDVGAFDPEGAAGLPTRMNFLDPAVISRALVEAGFVVEQADFFSRAEFVADMKLDGREMVGFIARKP